MSPILTVLGVLTAIAVVVAACVLLIFAVAGHATQDDVRRACAHHDGVAAVNGNAIRKYVACRDGYYVTVR